MFEKDIGYIGKQWEYSWRLSEAAIKISLFKTDWSAVAYYAKYQDQTLIFISEQQHYTRWPTRIWQWTVDAPYIFDEFKLTLRIVQINTLTFLMSSSVCHSDDEH